MKGVYRELALVTRFKLLMARRRFADSVRNTIEGKIALVMMMAAPFLMRGLLVSSTLRTTGASRPTEAGILAIAHLCMAVALVLGVSSRTARSLIVGWRNEPLVLCAGATRGLAAYHLWGEVVAPTALWLLVFFYVFYGGLVLGLGSHPPLSLVLHAIAHLLVTLLICVLSYRLTLQLLEKKPATARSVFNVTSTGSLVAFLCLVGAPRILDALSPTVISALATPYASFAMVYPPIAILNLSQGSFGGLVVWAGGVIVLPIIALYLADSSIRHPSPILFRELELPRQEEPRRRGPLFRRARRRRHGEGLQTLHVLCSSCGGTAPAQPIPPRADPGDHAGGRSAEAACTGVTQFVTRVPGLTRS